MTMMKAVRITEPGKVEICDLPEPKVGPEEVLVKVKILGLCGSDLATYRGINPLVSYPRIPGHEIAGEIIEAGNDVPKNFNAGLKVTVSPYTACGNCSACRAGRVNCCKNNQTMGVQREGAATELIVVPYRNIFKANGLSDEQIACVEPLSIGWHAVNRARVGPNDTVLVFGCGVVGLGAIAASAYKGAEVIAVDIERMKLDRAGVMGAEHRVNSKKENLNEKVRQLTFGEGPDVVIEAVGLPQTFMAAVDLVCFAGRVVYIGYAKNPVQYETKLFVSKELDILGSRNALNNEIEVVLNIFAGGKISIESLITQRYDLEHIADALRFWETNPAKVTKILLSI